MIPCQECSAPNQIGAIFCRECGTKLDLEMVRPDTVAQQSSSVAKNLPGMIARIIGLVVMLALFGGLIGLIMPATGRIDGVKDSDAMDKLKGQFGALTGRMDGKLHSADFSSEEVTAALNDILSLGKGEAPKGSTLVAEHLSVKFMSSGYVRLVLKSRFLGKLPVYTTVIGTVEAGADGVSFKPSSASAGRIPLVGGFRSLGVRRLGALFENQTQLEAVGARIREAGVSEGSVHIAVQ